MPNLDAQELEPANEEQAHEPKAENDAKWQLQDVNEAHAARDRGKLPNLRPRNTLRAPNRFAACITVDDASKNFEEAIAYGMFAYVSLKNVRIVTTTYANVRERTWPYTYIR